MIYARNKENKSYSSKHWVNTSDWYIYEREHIKKINCKAYSNISIELLTNQISSYSIGRILKGKLGIKFKKICSLEYSSTTGLNIIKFIESAMLKHTLLNEEYEFLFVKKFSLSSCYNNYYGWTEKEKKGYLSLIYDSFSMFLLYHI